MRVMMKAVVNEGGASNAYVAGYDVGGKTGTSEKVAEMQATGQRGLYIASFLGFAPIDDPEIAVLVMIDEPHGDSYYGGTVAAPVAAEIFKDILPYLGYEPQYTPEELESFAVKVPNLTGKTTDEARTELRQLGFNLKVVGEGESILSQLPVSGEKLSKGGTVIVYTEENADNVSMVSVPDFTGMTTSEVTASAASVGINVKCSGNTNTGSVTVAYDQDIAHGTEVAAGTTVTVYFRDNTSVDL